MKKALNNPVVVGVLVVLALAFVLRDAIHFSALLPDKNNGARSVASPLVLPAPAVVTPSGSPASAAVPPTGNKQQLTHTDWEAIAKTALSTRDPFLSAPAQGGGTSFVQEAPVITADDEQMVIPSMRLRAIVSGPETRFASIDGKLLEIGETVEGWKLVAIGVNRVQLRGKGGLLTLDIDGGARMGGRALKMSVKTKKNPTESKQPPASRPGVPNSVEELNIYQGLFDSLIKNGVVPNMPGIK